MMFALEAAKFDTQTGKTRCPAENTNQNKQKCLLFCSQPHPILEARLSSTDKHDNNTASTHYDKG